MNKQIERGSGMCCWYRVKVYKMNVMDALSKKGIIQTPDISVWVKDEYRIEVGR